MGEGVDEAKLPMHCKFPKLYDEWVLGSFNYALYFYMFKILDNKKFPITGNNLAKH